MAVPKLIGDWIHQIKHEGLENASQRFYSFYPAKVVEDADASQQGKSQVKVGLLGFSEAHTKFTYPVSPYAGANYGFYFPAHKDSSVWVSFDQGDVSVARVHGSWWPNKGKDTDAQGGKGNDSSQSKGAKKPSTSHVPTEFVKADGSAPTARGIKTKGGHVLIFEDDTDNYVVELSSGKMKTRQEQDRDKDNQPVVDSEGNPVLIDVVEINERSDKYHRVRLDSTVNAGQIVIATYGNENTNAEEITSEDTSIERDRKELEGRLRHQVLMRDTTSDSFVQVKTIGDSDTAFHQFLMSDTEQKIRAQSTNEHFFEIDDANAKSEWSVKDGFKWLLDQANKMMQGATPGGRAITFDDKNEFAQIVTPDNQTFRFDTSETLLQDDDHDINVSGGSDINIEATSDIKTTSSADTGITAHGDLTFDVDNDWTARILGALNLLITGNVTIEGAEVTIDSPSVKINSASVEIGQGNLQKLMTKIAMEAFNAHTHQYTFPQLPGPLAFTAAPLVPMTEDLHTTTTTTAG